MPQTLSPNRSLPNFGSFADGPIALPVEYLSFRRGAEEYGIDILKAQEIRGYEAPTRSAGVPHFIKGATNLRGVIVPIVDLRIKFGMEDCANDGKKVTKVLTVVNRVVGIVVDSVSDVITLSSKQLRPVPEFNSAIQSDHLLAIGALGGRMLIQMDIEKLMLSPEMGLLSSQLQ
jgi:purine-binding chemotaxis protein CheW